MTLDVRPITPVPGDPKACDRAARLRRLLAPQSVAIVGASPRPGSFGHRALENLGGFAGRVYPVNEKYTEIGGRASYPSIAALPEVPDCVILAVGRDQVVPYVRACAEAGAGGALIFSSGFAETGNAEHRALQDELSDIAAQSGLVILGPNCLGIANYAAGTMLTFMDFPSASSGSGHDIGLVSQSGAMGVALSQAAEKGVAFSQVLTFGNGCDVGAADMVRFLADDPLCRAIACVVEDSRDARAFADAARHAASRGKAVVVCKLAVSASGSSAAQSHTGALSGEYNDYAALLRDAGVVLISDLEALIETTAFFAKVEAPTAPGVAVIGASGGAGIYAADKADQYRVALPQPAEATRTVLLANIPEFGSARNPCDVTAQVLANPGSLAYCAEALGADPAYGALVTSAMFAAESMIPRLAIFEETVRKTGKPFCVAWQSGWREGPGARLYEESREVAVFSSMANCFQAIRAWQDRHATLTRRDDASSVENLARCRTTQATVAAMTPGAQTEIVSRDLLAAYAIPFPREVTVTSAEAAAIEATEIGFPVALKIVSRDVAHKSDAGGVRLGIASAEEAARAYRSICESVASHMPEARIDGVSIQQMVPPGVEMLVGARWDPVMGPLVTVGFGGVLVEVLNDVVSGVAPVTQDRAEAMIRALRSQALLDGFRGMAAVNVPALARIVSAASHCVYDADGLVAELDINPVICGAYVVAADALLVRSDRT